MFVLQPNWDVVEGLGVAILNIYYKFNNKNFMLIVAC